MTRQIQAHDKASQIVRFRPIYTGTQLIEIRKISGDLPETYVDAHEFAKELDGIVPGFRCSYDPPRPEPEVEEVVPDLEQMILTLRSNGYDVTKQANPGAQYVDDIAEFAEGIDGTRSVTVLPSQGGHSIVGAIQDAVLLIGGRDARDVEVYVEVDRALLIAEFDWYVNNPSEEPAGSELLTHLWPIVARVDDEGDVVLHVTSASRAQFGRGENHR